jgi:cobyric acid synthase
VEVGRAQAEAEGIPCHTDKDSQVVLNGKPTGNQIAYQYFSNEGRNMLRKEVNEAFDRLEKRYNPIVLEVFQKIIYGNLICQCLRINHVDDRRRAQVYEGNSDQ